MRLGSARFVGSVGPLLLVKSCVSFGLLCTPTNLPILWRFAPNGGKGKSTSGAVSRVRDTFSVLQESVGLDRQATGERERRMAKRLVAHCEHQRRFSCERIMCAVHSTRVQRPNCEGVESRSYGCVLSYFGDPVFRFHSQCIQVHI